jgi:hypothetical protein
MTSPSQTDNLAPVNDEDKKDWPVVGGRCHPDDMRMIDVVSGMMGRKKGVWAPEVVVEAARQYLDEHAPEMLVHFPRRPRMDADDE